LAIRVNTTYYVECDNCGQEQMDGYESEQTAREYALDRGWIVDDEKQEDVCARCLKEND
jgi:hypothetical protein